jgi:hypothetical protein
MRRSRSARHVARPGALLLLAVLAALLIPAAALAADGVPLFPAGAFARNSTENPDLSGPMLAFEVYETTATPATKLAVGSIHLYNTSTGANRRIGYDGGPASIGNQRFPSILDQNGSVWVVWQQQGNPQTTTWDLWLWRGNRQGVPEDGYPRLLVTGPAAANQLTPELGITSVSGEDHVVLAWADDRAAAGTAPLVFLLDLSADHDGNGVPDYLETTYNPAAAGVPADETGSLALGQLYPSVGAKGVFWIDNRRGATAYATDVYRAAVTDADPASSAYWENLLPSQAANPQATAGGAAWIGPGIAGGPAVWAKNLGDKAGIATILPNPGIFAVDGTHYALTGTHDGKANADPDVFFYEDATRQYVPLSNLPDSIQTTPAIAPSDGGSRVVWADTRCAANAGATTTDPATLSYTLYVTRVPEVSFNASKVTLPVGARLTFTTTVTPKLAGYQVQLQRGKRELLQHPFFLKSLYASYYDWSTVSTKTLTTASAASWTWRPPKQGVYYMRVRFKGGGKSIDGGVIVPHSPNVSKVIAIVAY